MSGPSKKYLLIDVPNHETSEGSNVGSSFLRIGSPEANPPMKALLEEIVLQGFIDDDRERGANENAASHATMAGAGGVAGMGHVLTKADRKAKTDAFLSRGGWHDHTDGNRISTTVGDKVEVVRGNYRMVVLGRLPGTDTPEDELDLSAGWDVSGGHIQDAGLTPGGIHEIKWVQTWDGTWKVVEVCEKGDTHSITHGDVVEEAYGNTITSITGAETATGHTTFGSLVPQTTKLRPTITERTWATAIHSYTGSSGAGNSVPTISETTYATDITGETTATHIKEKVTASTIESKTEGTVTITEYVGTSSKWATEVSATTYATTIKEVEHGGTKSSFATYGAVSEVELAGAKAGVTICGPQADIEISAIRAEIKAGLVFLEIEAGALYVELCIANKIEINLTREAKFDATAYRAAVTTLEAAGTHTGLGLKWKKLGLAISNTALKANIGISAD